MERLHSNGRLGRSIIEQDVDLVRKGRDLEEIVLARAVRRLIKWRSMDGKRWFSISGRHTGMGRSHPRSVQVTPWRSGTKMRRAD